MLLAAVAAAGLLGSVSVAHAATAAHVRPVPSLTPAATDALWHRLAHGHLQLAGTATTDCRPLRVIFYAQTDWRRLGTKLAASASACAQYYISVPPLSDNKTQERSDEAWRIRVPTKSLQLLECAGHQNPRLVPVALVADIYMAKTNRQSPILSQIRH